MRVDSSNIILIPMLSFVHADPLRQKWVSSVYIVYY